MLFIAPPEDANDIRAFCARFTEGIRVEYKSTFDDNVRRNLPKVLSSFANSLGGVLIIGVETQNGVPREPIQGFMAPAEELPLTIENICFQNVNPPLIPHIQVLQSDVAGRIFVVVEIDESWEAPHAIENSTKVYVRTGNAANPYELTNVDLIIELVRRRAEPDAKRQALVSTAKYRANNVLVADREETYGEISISPQYPRHALCTREECWTFFENHRYRGGHYFPFVTVRRVEDGIASYDRNRQYGQISRDGILFGRFALHVYEESPQCPIILMRDVLHPALRLLHCAAAFYGAVAYGGSLIIEISVHNIRLKRMIFLRPDSHEVALREIDDFQCFEDVVSMTEITDSERLIVSVREIVQNLMRNMCWSFWQSPNPFPLATFNQYLNEVLQNMGF